MRWSSIATVVVHLSRCSLQAQACSASSSFLTYYLQETLGFSAVLTGVAFLPMVVSLSITAQLSNIVLLPKIGPRPLIPVGMLMSAGALLMLTHLGVSSSYLTSVFPALVLLGLGIGLVFAPAINTATAGVEAHDAGVASASVNTSQQVGGSIGTALLNTLAASAATSFLIGKSPTKLNVELANVQVTPPRSATRRSS